jgi:ClpP class serine protease
MSGGTLIALAADQIVMDANAVLGPVDPQIGDMSAASIVKLLESKKPSQVRDESMLVLADIAAKSRIQVASFVDELPLKRLPKDQAAKLATILTEGRWTHDFPITVPLARELGLPISTDMPRIVYQLDLYQQRETRRPSVLYVPLHHTAAEREASKSPSSFPETNK